MLVLVGWRKPEYAKKPLGAKERTNNNLNTNMALIPGFEPSQIGGRQVLSPLHNPRMPQP